MAPSEQERQEVFTRAGGRCECTSAFCSRHAPGERCTFPLAPGFWDAGYREDENGSSHLIGLCAACLEETSYIPTLRLEGREPLASVPSTIELPDKEEASSKGASGGAPFALGCALALALRVGLGTIMALAWLAVEAHLPGTPGASIYGDLQMPTTRLGNVILGVWARWDAVHHLNLAMRGYFDLSPGDSVFYPLYAGLTRILAMALGGRYIVAGLLLSSLSAAAAFAGLVLIGDRLFGPGAGRWAAISLAVYPTAIFLVAPYTESLFLALTLGALVLAYRGRWGLASVPALLASLTRGPGLASALPLAILAWKQWPSAHRRSLPQVTSMLSAVAAPILGGVAFLAWRSLVGFPSMAETLRQYTGTTFVDPFTGILVALRQWIAVHDLPTTLDTLSAILFLGITAAMVINPRWRNVELLAYMVANVVFLLSRRTDGATSLKSMSRYVLVLFPAFLVAGDGLARARPRARLAYLVVSSSILIVLSGLYALWYFIG